LIKVKAESHKTLSNQCNSVLVSAQSIS
jgi:hypothetical protein